MAGKTRYLGKKKEPYDAELWAVFDALEVAIKETRDVNHKVLTIFIDPSVAMINIQKIVAKPEGLAVRDPIYQRANKPITNGHSVTLRWASGYSKIEGNGRADFAARSAAYRRGKETDYWNSLTHVKIELKRTRLAALLAWRQLKIQEREASRPETYLLS